LKGEGPHAAHDEVRASHRSYHARGSRGVEGEASPAGSGVGMIAISSPERVVVEYDPAEGPCPTPRSSIGGMMSKLTALDTMEIASKLAKLTSDELRRVLQIAGHWERSERELKEEAIEDGCEDETDHEAWSLTALYLRQELDRRRNS